MTTAALFLTFALIAQIPTPTPTQAARNEANLRYLAVHRFEGNVEILLQDIDKRIAEYRAILRLDPQHEKARYDLAQDLFGKGEDDEALSLLRGLVASSSGENSKVYTERLASFLDIRARSKQIVAPVKFTGEASAGKTFEHEFEPGLLFRLSPVDTGWEIMVVPRDSPTKSEFSSVVTLPYRGLNPRYLSADYGQSAKDVVSKGGASFQFVRNTADYDRASADVRIILGHTPPPAGKSYQEAMDDALRDMDMIPYCIGSLRITDSRLGGDAANQVIDWLRFEVELCGKQRR